VKLDNRDARVWYYKGFSEAALGKQEEAGASLAQAVLLHSQERRNRSAIDAALQRVQGSLREELQRAVLMAPGVETKGLQDVEPGPLNQVASVD
jgi:hypothetical protein